MSFLIDTSVVVDAIRGREPSSSFVAQHTFEGLYVSVVTLGEVLEGGMRPDLSGDAQLRRFLRFVSLFDVPSLTIREALLFAEHRARLRADGMLIPDNDLWIAATALAYDFTLVTRD